MTGAPRKEHEDGRTLAADDPRHGTYNGYSNLRCRCAACCAANTAQHAEWRHRSGRNLPRQEWLAAVASAREAELRCFKCRRWLPDESFPRQARRTARRGRHGWCTGCMSASQRERRARLRSAA